MPDSSKTHTGTLFLKEGRINVNSNGMIEGKVVIDMTSINVTDLQGEWKDKLEEQKSKMEELFAKVKKQSEDRKKRNEEREREMVEKKMAEKKD